MPNLRWYGVTLGDVRDNGTAGVVLRELTRSAPPRIAIAGYHERLAVVPRTRHARRHEALRRERDCAQDRLRAWQLPRVSLVTTGGEPGSTGDEPYVNS